MFKEIEKMVSLRSSRLRVLLWYVTAVLLGATSVSAQSIPAVGDSAPDFRLPTLEGESVQLSKLAA